MPQEDSGSDEEVQRVMAATAPLWPQGSDEWPRPAAAVPALPNWLRRQICRAQRGRPVKEAVKVELPPKAGQVVNQVVNPALQRRWGPRVLRACGLPQAILAFQVVPSSYTSTTRLGGHSFRGEVAGRRR